MKAQTINNWWTAFINLVVLSIAVALLTACGGGGGSGSGGGTSGISSGEIEGFGSIIVNGVRFHTNGAEVETEHGVTTTITTATQEDHLSKGMHVEVEVEFNDDGQTGTATRILVNDEVEGAISGLTTNSATGVVTFTILGQTVVAAPGVTNIDDTQWAGNLANVANGDFVEVHGLPDGNGTIQATFIEYKAADLAGFNALGAEGEFEVTGTIDNNGTFVDGSYFEMNGQPVNYTNSVVDFPPLQAGMLVEVKGTLNGLNEVVATRVHIEDGFGDNLAKVEVQGLIRDLGATTFTINGQQVNYSNATYFGGVEADLANGIKVEAEGPIVSSVLMAVKIKFKDNFRYEGTATYNAASQTFTITNPNPTPSNGDLTIVYDTNLARNDSSSALNANVTTQFEIRARQVSGTNLIATRVKDGSGNANRQTFEATVMAINNPNIEILNDGTGSGAILVETTGLVDTPLVDSDFEIETNDNKSNVTRATFFATLQEGHIIKARYDSGVEDQVEIELDE